MKYTSLWISSEASKVLSLAHVQTKSCSGRFASCRKFWGFTSGGLSHSFLCPKEIPEKGSCSLHISVFWEEPRDIHFRMAMAWKWSRKTSHVSCAPIQLWDLWELHSGVTRLGWSCWDSLSCRDRWLPGGSAPMAGSANYKLHTSHQDLEVDSLGNPSTIHYFVGFPHLTWLLTAATAAAIVNAWRRHCNPIGTHCQCIPFSQEPQGMRVQSMPIEWQWLGPQHPWASIRTDGPTASTTW